MITSTNNSNKVVLVTGAARRIGACIATTFHSRGFRVVIHCSQSKADAEALAMTLNKQRRDSATVVQANFMDNTTVDLLARDAIERWGQVDVLVNNASAFYPKAIADTSELDWDQLINSNLKAAYFLSKSLQHELRLRQGSIVNITDIHGDKALRNYSVYTIAKAGLKAMTRAMALEMAPHVRVNAVAPGAILWPEAESKTEESVEDRVQSETKILSGIPLGHLGKPEDIAEAAYFLATSASYVSGETVRVDGGRFLQS